MSRGFALKRTLRNFEVRGEYREANTKAIYGSYDLRRKRLTYRVMVNLPDQRFAAGRYVDLDTAVIVRDILFYLRGAPKHNFQKPYYSEIGLQKLARRHHKKDIAEFFTYLRDKHDVTRNYKNSAASKLHLGGK